MKAVIALLICLSGTLSFGGGASDQSSTANTDLAPIPLRLPPPRYQGWNGPLDLHPLPPDMEPLSDRPRPPFLAPVGVTNLAWHAKVTASDARTRSLDKITDGAKTDDDADLVQLRSGKQWVQIDLGGIYPIYAVVIWHDLRERCIVVNSVVVQIAEDAAFTRGVKTLFNNDRTNALGLGKGADRPYMETYEGKLIEAKGVKARFFRFYSNGSNVSSFNFYSKIELWGSPGK